MQSPKCNSDDWCEIASHDPWSGRPMIACNVCGEYTVHKPAEREEAYAVIAGALTGERQHDAPADAGKILDALENAGLTIART